MSTANVTLFDDEFLKKLEYLNIISKRLFAGQLRAERRTRKRGTGLEFADYRAYVAGDDFRHLDWKAYLRLNRLILKLFEVLLNLSAKNCVNYFDILNEVDD